jgi:hypothetical protein
VADKVFSVSSNRSQALENRVKSEQISEVEA